MVNKSFWSLSMVAVISLLTVNAPKAADITQESDQGSGQSSDQGSDQSSGQKFKNKPSPKAKKNPLKVYASAWGLTLKQNGKGYYNDVYKALVKGLAKKPRYLPIPSNRAFANFKQDDNSCIYPNNIDYMSKFHTGDKPLIAGPAMVNARVFLFASPGNKIARSVEDIKGKTLAHPAGSPISKTWAGKGIKFITVHDETSKARMLLSGRVDYMTGTLPDAQLVFNALKKPLPAHDAQTPLMKYSLTVVCHDTVEARAFISGLTDHYDKDGKDHINDVNRANTLTPLP